MNQTTVLFFIKSFRSFNYSTATPQFTQKPSDLSADIGTNVTLPCHARGHPEPQLSWRRDDNVSLFSQHRGPSTVTKKNDGGLFITSQCLCFPFLSLFT